MMNIEKRLKEVRKTNKLTQPEFADRISISRGYIANLELGNREINDRIIKLTCQEFNINENWLRTGEGDMINPDMDEYFLNLLGEQYRKLSDKDKEALIYFIKLTPEQRKSFMEFIKNLVNNS